MELVDSLIKEAIFRRAKREYTLSLARLESALELAPTHPATLRELGRTLSYYAAETKDRQQKDVLLDRAEAALKRAAELGASRAAGLHDLAWVYDERGDYIRAVELYREAVAANNEEGTLSNAALAYNLACALAKAGRGNEALDALEPVIVDVWKWVEKDRDLETLRESVALKSRLEALLAKGRQLTG